MWFSSTEELNKFVKLSDKLYTRSLCSIIKIENPLLDTIQRHLLTYASRHKHITSHRNSRKIGFGNFDLQPSITDSELVNNTLEQAQYTSNDELVIVLVDTALKI